MIPNFFSSSFLLFSSKLEKEDEKSLTKFLSLESHQIK